jgi:hypothetical protein
MPEILIAENIIGADMDALRRRFDAVFEPDVWQQPAITREAQARVVATVCRDVSAVLQGGAARNFANFSRPQERRA